MLPAPTRSRHAVDPARGGLARLARLAVRLSVVTLVVGAIGGGAFAARRVLGGGGGSSAPGATSALAAALPTTSPAGVGDLAGMSDLGQPTTPAGTASATASPPARPPADQAGLTVDDRTAGVLKSAVPQHGSGRLVVVPGSVPAPGDGTVKRVRVDVEAGLPVDSAAFAAFVMSTLNDPRSWGHGGRMTFARTSGPYDIRVVLASPDTSARLCAPLQTMGTLSCGQGSTAILTLYRWVKAIPDYGTDRTGYRHYVVNHEVGHTLGHGHEMCPGSGRVAPLMMQQTKGLKGCLPNSWPYP